MRTQLLVEPSSEAQDPVKELLEAGRRRELDRQGRLLRGGATRDQVKAAATLQAWGGDAVEPLCHALGDPDDRVRVAAVKSLEAIGDPRAMAPLMAGLQGSLAGGTGRRHVALRHVLLTLSVVGPLASILFTRHLPESPASFLFALFPLGLLVFTHLIERTNHALFQQACITALASLAEKDPAPALGQLLPDLKALAGDRMESGDVRRALADATARIEALTAEVRQLPIAAASPEPSLAQLPAPAGSSRTDPGPLPRVSG